MSKVTLKIEIEEDYLESIKASTNKTSSDILLINATPITESDDAVSRKAVHDWISEHEYGEWVEMRALTMHEDIDKLPPVLLKPKQGEWIKHDWGDLREKGYYKCSVCGGGYQRFEYGVRKSDVPYINGQKFTAHKIDYFCPRCGAEMRRSDGGD